jgi:isobutyryl-CoA dehydrogenase
MLHRTVLSCSRTLSARSFTNSVKVGRAAQATGMDIISPLIGLNEERTEFYNLAKNFADNELKPYASKWDRDSEFPVETFKKFGELGFGGIFVKEDVGGTALKRVDAVSIVEALATGCVGTTAMLTIHNMCASCIDKFGNDEQRNKWLPKIVAMDLLISFCLTEPGTCIILFSTSCNIH